MLHARCMMVMGCVVDLCHRDHIGLSVFALRSPWLNRLLSVTALTRSSLSILRLAVSARFSHSPGNKCQA